MEELEQKANTTFERDILSEVDGLFTLSQQNLKQMKHLNEEYDQRVSHHHYLCICVCFVFRQIDIDMMLLKRHDSLVHMGRHFFILWLYNVAYLAVG